MKLEPTDLRSAAITRITEKEYDSEIQRLLIGYLKNKDSPMFIDIGANEGFHSVSTGVNIPNSKIVASEPNPRPYNRHLGNIEMNDLRSRVKIHILGLGEKNEKQKLFVPAQTGSGGSSLRNLHPEEGHPELVPIEIISLDSLELPCDFIKIDVEGAEFEVVSGALETIKSNQPVIIIELLTKWMFEFEKQPNDVFRLLSDLGYRAFAIGGGDTRPIDFVDDETIETNFLFIHHSETVSPDDISF